MRRPNFCVALEAANQAFYTSSARSLLRLQLPKRQLRAYPRLQAQQRRWIAVRRVVEDYKPRIHSPRNEEEVDEGPRRFGSKYGDRRPERVQPRRLEREDGERDIYGRRNYIPKNNDEEDEGPSTRRFGSGDDGPRPERTSDPRKFGPKDEAGIVVKDGPVYDEDIHSHMVRMVSENGTLENPVTRYSILSSINRKDYWLKQVRLGTDGSFPVCKIVKKWDERQAQRARSKKLKDPNMLMKEIEMGWAISGGDLEHKLSMMKGFLEEGRRVELIIGSKKGAKTVEMRDMEVLVARIQKAIVEVGASETTPLQGKIGQRVTIAAGNRKAKDQITTEEISSNWTSRPDVWEENMKLMRKYLEQGKRIEISIEEPKTVKKKFLDPAKRAQLERGGEGGSTTTTKVMGKEALALQKKEREEWLERWREEFREAGATEWMDMHGTVKRDVRIFVERRKGEDGEGKS
ncbi:MAG: hypothetical protein MMC33_006169 [Icmadophila ericetorum]|nr:hypothetical protein [Icmadophila ericetorum]